MVGQCYHDKSLSRALIHRLSSAGVQVILYSNKGRTSTLYKSLSMRFRGRAAFAEVRDTAKEVTQAASIVTFPTLKVVGAHGAQQPYDGALASIFVPNT